MSNLELCQSYGIRPSPAVLKALGKLPSEADRRQLLAELSGADAGDTAGLVAGLRGTTREQVLRESGQASSGGLGDRVESGEDLARVLRGGG